MVIQPWRKKNGEIYKNIELLKICFEKLKSLRDGVGAESVQQKEKMEDDFLRICGGSDNAQQIMAYLEQICNVENEVEAQHLFARTLEPVEGRKLKGGN